MQQSATNSSINVSSSNSASPHTHTNTTSSKGKAPIVPHSMPGTPGKTLMT